MLANCRSYYAKLRCLCERLFVRGVEAGHDAPTKHRASLRAVYHVWSLRKSAHTGVSSLGPFDPFDAVTMKVLAISPPTVTVVLNILMKDAVIKVLV